MCFSAGASFEAGAVIIAVGAAAVRKVQKPSQRIFTCLPFLFGIQQLAEGCVWLALQNPGHGIVQNIGAYVFLIGADVVWPVMIPYSVLLMEENSSE